MCTAQALTTFATSVRFGQPRTEQKLAKGEVMGTHEFISKHTPTLVVCCNCVAEHLHGPCIKLAGGPASLSLGLLANAPALMKNASLQTGALRVYTVFLNLVKEWFTEATRQTEGPFSRPRVILILHTNCASPTISHLTEAEATAKLGIILRLLEERLPYVSFQIMTSHEYQERGRTREAPTPTIQNPSPTIQSADAS